MREEDTYGVAASGIQSNTGCLCLTPWQKEVFSASCFRTVQPVQAHRTHFIIILPDQKAGPSGQPGN